MDWKNCGGQLYDKSNQTFIFSLNLNKKYDMLKKEDKSIYCDKDWGPDFGAEDFGLYKNMKKGITYANKNCNFLCDKNLELTGGKGEKETFEVDEFEVFKVLFD